MIKKGESYTCIKTVCMDGNPKDIAYKKGKIYVSDINGSLKDEDGTTHYWNNIEDFNKYFIKGIISIKEDEEDRVNHPSHYTWLEKLCGIEVIDITRHMNFNLGQILKYILRLGHKKDKNFTNYEKVLSDLNKAKYYLENEINRVDKLCKKCGNH